MSDTAGGGGSSLSEGSAVLQGCTVFAPFVESGYSFRMLQASDYDKNFLGLLGQLTSVGTVTRQMFEGQLEMRSASNNVWTIVVEDAEGSLVACGSIFVELKFTHECGKVGHIEDIVVSSAARGGGVGRKIVTTLSNLAKSAGCYKVVLDCNDANIGFYEKIGFVRKENQMAQYFQ